jgi:hypothetical protein
MLLFVSSSSGDDSRDGTTRGAPLATIQRALENLGVSTSSPGVHEVILLKGSVFFLTASLLIPSNVTLRAEEPGSVSLVGGIVLDESREVRVPAEIRMRFSEGVAGRVRAFSVPEMSPLASTRALGVAEVWSQERRQVGPSEVFAGEVFLDRDSSDSQEAPARTQMASWPPAAVPGQKRAWLRIDSVPGPREFSCWDDRMAAWSRRYNIAAQGFWQHDASESTEKILAMDAAEKKVRLKPVLGIETGRRVRFINVLEEISQPGDYALEMFSKVVYVLAPETTATAAAPPRLFCSTLKAPLVRVIEGSQNVTLSGLVLESSCHGGISGVNAENLLIEDCQVRNVGRFGISVKVDDSGTPLTTSCTIRRCRIQATGEEGVILDSSSSRILRIEDSTLERFGRLASSSPGVLLKGVGTSVARCTFRDGPHSAVIMVGSGHVEECTFEDVCNETGSSGAVLHVGWTSAGSNDAGIIRGNTFRNLSENSSEIAGVYLDSSNGSSNPAATLVSGNTFQDLDCTGVRVSGRDRINIRDNVFVNCTMPLVVNARARSSENLAVTGNVVAGRMDRFLKLTDGVKLSDFAEFSRNVQLPARPINGYTVREVPSRVQLP